MIKARYKCGYCNHFFALAYFNSQDIPERNIGCPNCRVAGEKTILIKKIRDERGVVDEHLFKRSKEISNLDYPIAVLEAERDNVRCPLKSQVDQLQEAIDILTNEKYRRVREEFKKEVEKKGKNHLDYE